MSRLKIKSSIFKSDVMWADSFPHRKQTEDTKRILAKLLNQGPSTSMFTFDQFKSTIVSSKVLSINRSTFVTEWIFRQLVHVQPLRYVM